MRKAVRKGEILTAAELATAMSMTWRNIRLIIDGDASFPVVKRGAEGHEWNFDLAAVLDWFIKRDEQTVSRAEVKRARLAKLAGLSTMVVDGESRAGLTVDEIRSTAQALIQAQRLKEQQAELVPAEPARAFWADYHEHFQSEVIGLLSRIDPAGQLSPGIRKLIDDDMRTLLVTLQGRMDKFIEGYRGNNARRT